MYTSVFLLLFTVTYGGSVGDWRPVGQGDPLIDPTHVYSPPHVQHVHYWLKAPSISLEPPPSRVGELSQVAGWPQITSHYQATSRFNPTTTPISITTLYSTMEDLPTTMASPQTFAVQQQKQQESTSNITSSTLIASTTTPPPTTTVTFVIQGHSKVKKYGPLPESFNSIHNVNHNHLTSRKV